LHLLSGGDQFFLAPQLFLYSLEVVPAGLAAPQGGNEVKARKQDYGNHRNGYKLSLLVEGSWLLFHP